jgi:hypothetical protein
MEEKRQTSIWIISEGRYVNLDLSNICEQPASGPVTEYAISELAKYLLSPKSISVEEKVIGCRVRYNASRTGIIERLKKIFFADRHNAPGGKDPRAEEIISSSSIGAPPFQDEDLNRHFIRINDLLRPFDPAKKKIDGLNREKVEDITAVCEDIGGSRYQLNLQGNIGDKINYVLNSMSKRVNVVFSRAYLSKGLFEMRGFQFRTFNPHMYYRLIKFMKNNQPRYCVLNADYHLEYWVSDHELINFMHLFEQSIKTDPKLQEALSLCVKGEAKPLKLFFSQKLDQHYNEKYLPVTYRRIFDMYEMTLVEKAAIANMLNNHQSIVSFNYVPRSEAGRQKLCINISVLHDIKALDPIRSKMPQLYSEINKKAPSSDIGRLYLLDSMKGFQYV